MPERNVVHVHAGITPAYLTDRCHIQMGAVDIQRVAAVEDVRAVVHDMSGVGERGQVHDLQTVAAAVADDV